MGHSVGKAAENATKKSFAKAEETRTYEQILRDIRKNRAADLFITPDDQDFLLAERDRLAAELEKSEAIRKNILIAISKLEEENEQFRKVYEQENSAQRLTLDAVPVEDVGAALNMNTSSAAPCVSVNLIESPSV